MYLSEYISLIKEVYSNDFERTIANFRIQFFKETYDLLYYFLQKTKTFKYFLANDKELDEIKEIKLCIIDKESKNLTICLVNSKFLTINNKKKNNNIKVIIKKEGENSELIKNYIENSSNGFNSFLKKKNSKEKISLATYRKYLNDKDSVKSEEYSNKYQKIKINVGTAYYMRKKIIKLNLYLENDKISTRGGNKCSLRTMIPNTITISFYNNSMIMIFQNGLVQIIPSKKEEDCLNDFLDKILFLIGMLIKINKRFTCNEIYTRQDEYIKKLRKENFSNTRGIDEILNYEIKSMNNDFSLKNINVIPFPIIDDFYFSKIKFYGGNNINIKNINNIDILYDRIKIIDIILKNYREAEKNLLKYKKTDILKMNILELENIMKDFSIIDLKNDLKHDFINDIETNLSNNLPKVYVRSWVFVIRIYFINLCDEDKFTFNPFLNNLFEALYKIILRLIIINFTIDFKKIKHPIYIKKKKNPIIVDKISSLPKYFSYQDQVDKLMEIVLYLLLCYYIEKYNFDKKLNFLNIELYNKYEDYSIFFDDPVFDTVFEDKDFFNFIFKLYKKAFKMRKNDKLIIYISYLRRKMHHMKNKC